MSVPPVAYEMGSSHPIAPPAAVCDDPSNCPVPGTKTFVPASGGLPHFGRFLNLVSGTYGTVGGGSGGSLCGPCLSLGPPDVTIVANIHAWAVVKIVSQILLKRAVAARATAPIAVYRAG